jgi:hypothetical protein
VFEQAVRKKYRFPSPQGELSTEEIFDLPLTSSNNRANLDDIARSLNKQLKSGNDVSFVNPDKKSDPEIQAKFDLIMYVIKLRIAENEAALKQKENAAKRQKILAIMSDREDESLRNMPLDELKKLIESL